MPTKLPTQTLVSPPPFFLVFSLTLPLDEQSFYLDDPLIPASEYVGPSAPWVAGRLYSFVPPEPLRPTLFAWTAFNGNKYNFYCIIRGAYTGIIIDRYDFPSTCIAAMSNALSQSTGHLVRPRVPQFIHDQSQESERSPQDLQR